MSDQELQPKPVWRLNTGNGVPSDATGRTFIPCSVIPIDKSKGYLLDDEIWTIEGFLDIYAYETTRTRIPKRLKPNDN